MKNNNSAVIEKLKLVRKRMNRLREGFRLEKESALEDPDIMELEKLRERSKSIYQMEMVEYSRDIKMLKRNINSDQSKMEEAEDLSELCMKEAASLLAHFVSAPNRLIRIYKAEGLSEKRKGDNCIRMSSD
ncbi:MAG: hypothetical protein KAT09_00755 [Candidatus Aegiribacteria sp.]|nr:hypothetical protein [Candidatus Aegiribacteria sp.]